VEESDPALKKRVIERAVEFPEAIGSQLFVRITGWDAGKADAALAQITVPTFVLQSTYVNAQRVRMSMQPGEVTPWMQFVQSRIPNSELDTISGVGHFAMLEAPDVVNEKIQRFIDK
jgi:pimeloyl-ACP methyl ester carboxylesterase